MHFSLTFPENNFSSKLIKQKNSHVLLILYLHDRLELNWDVERQRAKSDGRSCVDALVSEYLQRRGGKSTTARVVLVASNSSVGLAAPNAFDISSEHLAQT